MDGETFEGQILTLLANEEGFLARHRSHFTPDFFRNEVNKQIATLILKYYDEYDGIPSKKSMRSMVDYHMERHPELDLATEYRRAIKDTYTDMSRSDSRYIMKNLERVIRERRIDDALKDAAEKFHKGEYDGLLENIQRATSFKLKQEDNILRWEDMTHFTYVEDRQKAPPIATGYLNLDKDLAGGVRPSELAVVIGGTGSGKSFWLVNICREPRMRGKAVLFVSMEMNLRQISMRWDSMVAKCTTEDLEDEESSVQARKRIVRWQGRHPDGIFRAMFWPMWTMTSREIIQAVQDLESEEGRKFDVIMIDYGDLLKSSTKYTSTYDDLGAKFYELKSMAQYLNVPIWTVSQVNRPGLTVKDVELYHIAESLKKAHVCDAIFTISRTGAEVSKGLMRLKSVKMRSHESGKEYFFATSYAKSRVRQILVDDYHAQLSSANDKEKTPEELKDAIDPTSKKTKDKLSNSETIMRGIKRKEDKEKIYVGQ